MLQTAMQVLIAVRERAQLSLEETVRQRDVAKDELAQTEQKIVALTERIASTAAALALLQTTETLLPYPKPAF